jgi:hypothetical protein
MPTYRLRFLEVWKHYYFISSRTTVVLNPLIPLLNLHYRNLKVGALGCFTAHKSKERYRDISREFLLPLVEVVLLEEEYEKLTDQSDFLFIQEHVYY